MSDLINNDFERNVLGAMLLDNSVIDDVVVKLSKDHFAVPTNRAIFVEIVKQFNQNKYVDIATVIPTLSDIKAEYIASLTNIGTSGNVSYYVDQIKKLFVTRQMRAELSEKMQNLSPDNVLDTIHELDSSLMEYMNLEKVKPIEVKDMVVPFIESLQKPSEKRTYIGYDTGISNLNDVIDGIQSRKLTIIGARPSIGKSALGLDIIANIAKIEKIPVSMFSFEMPRDELMKRLVSVESNVPIYNLEHKFFGQADVSRINKGMGTIYNMNMQIYDKPVENELKLYSMIRQQAKQGVKCFLIDHLGLIRHSNRSIKRFEAVHDITIHLHDLAKELNVPIIVLCQLKRDAEGKKPSLSDLRESGDIEQDADVIMFIHRERAMNNELQIQTELIVEKNRGGSTGVAKTIFFPRTTKFIADLAVNQNE